jgi:hypothetical protein
MVKKIKKMKKQNGGDNGDNGDNVINASADVIKSMKDLGQSIFNEIYSITHIQNDINNVSEVTAIPTVSEPTQFNPPKL